MFHLAIQLQLETEKRKRAETELSLEREKRLRADVEYKATISYYESILYATTHGLPRMWDEMKPIHRQMLWFEPAREPLTLDQPPTSKVEQDYQDWFTKEILPQLDDDILKDAGQVTSKNVEEEEEIFEDRVTGDLPTIKIPQALPAALPVARWRAARLAMSVSSIEPARASLTAHA